MKTSKLILVTGAAGAIGREIVAQLARRGDRVVAMDRQSSEHLWRSALNDGERQRIVSVVGDCADERDVRDALTARGDVDGVVHLAARTHAGAGTPIEVFSTNTLSTFTVLSSAGARGVGRAVIASSIHATGIPANHHGLMPRAFPLSEADAIALDDWYSLSKRVDELTAEMVASRWGMPVVALRYPLVKTLPELRVAVRAAADDPRRGVREGWTYLTSGDAARAALCALDADTDGAEILHVAAADTLLPMPTDAALHRYAPGIARRREFPGRSTPMDTSLARARIGFEPRDSVFDAAKSDGVGMHGTEATSA